MHIDPADDDAHKYLGTFVDNNTLMHDLLKYTWWMLSIKDVKKIQK